MNELRKCGCGEMGGIHKNECAIGLDLYELRTRAETAEAACAALRKDNDLGAELLYKERHRADAAMVEADKTAYAFRMLHEAHISCAQRADAAERRVSEFERKAL